MKGVHVMGRVESKKNRQKKNKFKKLWVIIIVILILAIGVGVVWGAGVWDQLNKLNKSDSDSDIGKLLNPTKPDIEVAVPTWEGKERVNILLLGGDARDAEENEMARSDSMIVLSIDPTTKQANLMSILRDTYTKIEGYGSGRINTAITLGGAPLAMKTIGDLLGLEIQYYVYTDFEGFKALVDSIGGVNFDVEKRMRYRDNADGNRYDIDLEPGYQHLDGDKALQYVRFRHDALSDYTRTERQRNFLMAVAKQSISTWNVIRLKDIIADVSPYIDTNMSPTDMIKLGQLGFDLEIGESAQIPPMELVRETTRGGASVVGYTSEEDIQSYVQELVTYKPPVVETTLPDGEEDATNDATTTE